MGIHAVHPGPHGLTIRLDAQPFVVRHWAERLLPVDPTAPDEIHGICGLRFRTTYHHVLLSQPGLNTSVRLTGFPTRWWHQAVDAIIANAHRHRAEPCFLQPDRWTPAEQQLQTWRTRRRLDPHVGSTLLRRIRLTTCPDGYGGTDMWSDPCHDGHTSWVLEMLRGPDHDQLLSLLTDPVLGSGLHLQDRWCWCSASRKGEGCRIMLTTADGTQRLLLRDLGWDRPDRTDTERRGQMVAEYNEAAFS
ncbi:hypothetical protein ACFU7Y_02930 [Kitasatospora sp. NPDC057542]|uniref:hypothetical protein n=1 Tax=Kitasatospora sp. NPDC057542 TaxID=3346162 RepID=UPI003696FE81